MARNLRMLGLVPPLNKEYESEEVRAIVNKIDTALKVIKRLDEELLQLAQIGEQ